MLLLTIRRSLALPMLFALLALPTPAVPPEDVLKPFADKLDKPIRLQIDSLSIPAAFDALARQADLLIRIDQTRVSIAELGKRAFSFTGETTARGLLPVICRAGDLGFDVRDGAIFITTPAEAVRPYLATRIYDLTSLAYTHPHFIMPPEIQYMENIWPQMDTNSPASPVGGAGNVPALARLIEALHIEKGKPLGFSLFAIDSRLVVTATHHTHTEISALLEQIEAPRRRTVAIEARWYKIGTAELDRILRIHAPTGLFTPDAADKALADIAELIQANKAQTLAMARQISFNNQHTWLAASRVHSFIEDLTPVVANQSASFDPTIGYAYGGTGLLLHPIISLSGTEVQLTVQANYADVNPKPIRFSSFSGQTAPQPPLPPLPLDAPPAVPTAHNAIEHLDIQRSAMRTSVRIPVNGAVLLAVGSQQVTSNDPAGEERVLFLRTRLP